MHDGRKMTFAPVRILAGAGLTQEVRDVQSASDAMLGWPGRGSAWRRAADAISEALYGRTTPEKARAAFVDAAREEGVLIEG